ncbi:MAG: histone deacetylase [Desulfobacteraceae bacterium]
MAITGYVYDKRYLLHDPGPGHPERPDRLRAIQRRVVFSGLIKQIILIEPYEAPLAWIEKLHDYHYIERFRTACQQGRTFLDEADNGIGAASFDVARLAVGGVFAACDAMMQGVVQNAFCAVRPAGHHAERAQARGFCFFNNVALGAKYLQEKYGLEKIAIVDWDAHHGNGTQHLLEEDPAFLYISLHEDPSVCYPGTGWKSERGRGAGVGYTLNFPFPSYSRDPEYLKVMDEEVLPALKKFRPDCLMISAGFDGHALDPMSRLRLSDKAYMIMGGLLVGFAREFCQGRVISVLEGGYNLEVLEDCVFDHIQILNRPWPQGRRGQGSKERPAFTLLL